MLQKDTTKAENKLLQELLMISIKELDSTLKASNNKEKNILRLKKIIKAINGGPNSGNHNPGQGRGVGKPANSIDVSKYSTYEDFEQDMFRGENRKENIEKLKKQGINSKDKMYLYFVNEKFKKQKIIQMSLDEAKDTILENIPKSVAEGWFIKADSSYKKKIVKLIVENDNLRSASLSLAYETYKELINKNIGFNDFLNKELDLYRGDPEGKKFIEADSTSFISYTPFEDMAKKFGKVITKKTIKPKETLGVLRQVGEFEFLVPTFNQKKDVHKSKNDNVRMNDLLQKMDKILNGGPGSGNHNPGQGRGVGKPNNKTGKFAKSSSASLKMSENSKKFYEKLNPKIQESFEKCVSRLKKTNISLDNVELEFVNSNTSGGDNGWVNVVDGDNIDSKMIVNLIKPVLKKFTKKEQDVYKHAFVADNSSEAIIDHELGHVLMYKKAAEIGIKPKSAHLFAEMIVKNEAKKLNIDLNDESTENFSEYAHRNYTEFIAEAYSRPDYSKLTQNVSDSLCNNKYSKDDYKKFIMENLGFQTNENKSNITKLNSVLNGGPNSGNHNPGQGRGKGKPNNSPSKIIDSYKEKYSDFWLNGVGDNGFETATKKGAENYKNIVDLTEKQKDIMWNSGEYDRMTMRIAYSQDEIENNFKALCKNNLTENDFYKIKNLFYDWSTNLGPRGKDGLFLDTPGIILEKDSEAFKLYKAYIQTILYESGMTSKKLFRGEPKKFDNKPKQFVSYTDSMMSAVNFARGNIENVIVEEIPINKIIAVDDMMKFSGYRTEKEWIVDSGIYE